MSKILRRIGDILFECRIAVEDFFDEIIFKLHWIKWGWQRMKKGYSEWDLYNFDSHLFEIIYNGLEDFMKLAKEYVGEFEDEKVKKDYERIIELAHKYVMDVFDLKKHEKKEWDELFDLLKKYWHEWWI